uniref:Uncharacterized protein n=1 Tax=Amphimedon queenslandica TaxID=400682 RepID=A0A1X7ULQ6_AMPQE
MGYIQEEGCFVVYSGCSHGHYCKTSDVNFTLESVDKQCTLNKSGLLCGKCAEGLSLMLGSDRCGECSNYSLFLLIPFALAGIILIAFITAFDLTVSTGSINGLLFYANIVKINDMNFLRNVSVLDALKPDIIPCGSKYITGWYFDPTMKYWGSERSFMVVVTVPCIERHLSRYRCCKCWVKLKPFFDAYNGPYDDKNRMWTGFLLLMRIIYAVLVIVFAILLGVVAVTKGPYQKKCNNYLECFHYVNLIFLAAINDTNINSKASYIFSYIFVSLVVLVFLCIVIYRFTQMRIWKKIKSQIMRMPQTARKISQRHKYLRSLRVPFVDDRHVVTHDMENMVTVELYDEDGDFVTRRRETLIREDLID